MKKEFKDTSKLTGVNDHHHIDINSDYPEMDTRESNEQLSKKYIEDESTIKELQPRSRGLDFLNSLEKVKEKTPEKKTVKKAKPKKK